MSALGAPTGTRYGERTLLRPTPLGLGFKDTQRLLRQGTERCVRRTDIRHISEGCPLHGWQERVLPDTIQPALLCAGIVQTEQELLNNR